MCDCVTPSAFNEKMRNAIKEHNCCECSKQIKPGEKYQYCSGVWDGAPDSYKTCLLCVKLRENYANEAGQNVAFEGLKEAISNEFYFSYGINEFINDNPEFKAELKNLFNLERK